MMPWWVLLIFVLGANFALWGTVGLVRLVESLAGRRRGWASTGKGGTLMAVMADAGPAGHALPVSPPVPAPLTTRDVAVLIPAHNEALVLEESLRSIMALVPRDNVHVVSDGSTDATVEIARRSGARVIETQENVGKAGALEEAIGRFGLISRFAVVMLLDRKSVV